MYASGLGEISLSSSSVFGYVHNVPFGSYIAIFEYYNGRYNIKAIMTIIHFRWNCQKALGCTMTDDI